MFYLALFPGPATVLQAMKCWAGPGMLGGDWEQGYVLSPRLHYQQKIFHSCITDIGTLLGDSIQDRLEDEANSAFSQITDVLNGKCHIAIHC